MKTTCTIFCSILVLMLPWAANAVLVVDTGQPTSTASYSLYSYLWHAAEFSTTQDYYINGIQGWMNGGGTATAAIYADDFIGNDFLGDAATGEIPGTELFSAAFSAPAVDGWYGPSGLSQLLPTGTYWVAFEVRSGQDLDGVMPLGAPDPLTNGAYTMGAGNWVQYAHAIDYGIRIAASPVPEPATMLLLGSGLIGLVGFRRKFRKG